MGPTPVHTVGRSADGGQWSGRLSAEIGKAVLGQLPIIERLQIALLTGGHVLLEGLPGLAKTLLVKSLSQALGAEFERIQFTPDLLPSDVVGTMVFSPADGRFSMGRSSPTWCWLTKSTERRPRCRARCWKLCRSDRSLSVGSRTHCRNLSW